MKSPNGIKTILYDLDGTLRFNQPPGREFFLDQAFSLGVPISGEDRRRTAIWEHRYWAESAEVLLDVVEYTDADAFWVNYSRRQLQAAGLAPGQAQSLAPQLHSHMKENYRPQDVILPETYEVLAQLRGAGYVVGVVSNREKPFGEYLTERGLDSLVHFSVSGGEAGSKKPDRGIFEYALGKAGSHAGETIYVGDNYFADVVGAQGAGIQPVLYDPAGVFDDWSPSGAGAVEARPVRADQKAAIAAAHPLSTKLAVIRSHAEQLTLLDRRTPWPGHTK